ncbi:hypothetical protein A2872_04380 [Candidatus Gottesmanbacteria bacterium RIFCSPHIGHO2_01_FULL_42_12]|uniref:Uncharacterized protein n=1 Tax=Candidatus Gottesmanbacteria bacterium RIFCSPHIGHO2_01_FULL_42_12 TaxID=1798377 RepID=A0A1F5Z153_9BACT|nr:MAG: hypothetical protein A2872_04380 [Candidatus Gottesmanbacteria bacterium RIFCSPHIGHO2_01_FULL_42_12]
MAKKTREQKIIADLRRQLQKQNSSGGEVRSSEYTFKPKEAVPVVPATNSELSSGRSLRAEPTTNYLNVKRDLLKTLILTVLAIGVQVVLWYVLNRR